MIKMRRSNLQSFCRTCLEHFQPKSASKFNINQTPNLTKLLIVCTSLNINEDADAVYPQNLCKKCYDTMQQFREFRDMAQQSDDVLRKIVVAEEEDKNIDTTNAIDEDGFFNDTSDSVNPEPEIKMEFEVEDMQENSIINKTVDAADDFANDSDSSAPTTSTAKKRKIHDETDKFLCKFYGCNAEFKTLQSLDDHIASQHATENDNNELKSDMKDLKKDMKAIKAALKYQKVMLEKMSTMLYVPINNLKIFPLKDLDEVKALDSFLPNFSDDELITYTRSIIGSTPITKCIHLLFTENALVHVNWDGRQKKFPVKSLKFFQQIIFYAVKGPDIGFGQYEVLMKKGFRSSKSKIYRHTYNKAHN